MQCFDHLAPHTGSPPPQTSGTVSSGSDFAETCQRFGSTFAMYRASLERFSDTRSITITLLAGLSQEQLDTRPDPDKWSPGEVMDHLLLFDQFFLADCAKLIELARSGRPASIYHSFIDVDVAPAFVPKAFLPLLGIPFTIVSQVTPRFLRDFLVRTRLFPVQHPRFATPRRMRRKAELDAELRHAISAFAAIYDQNADLDFRNMSTSHPMIGRNNMIQILDFANNHEQRHQAQIRDAIARYQSVIHTARN